MTVKSAYASENEPGPGEEGPREPSRSAFAMARLYIRREWNSDPEAIESTARDGLSDVDLHVLKARFGRRVGVFTDERCGVEDEVGAALVTLCKRELASRR